MFGFCKHNWQSIGVTYSPPPRRMGGIPSCDSLDLPEVQRMFERDSRGVTCVLMRCSLCNKTKQEELWGAPIDGDWGETATAKTDA